MALRAIRLVVPAGSTAFRSVIGAQKVRTEKKADTDLYLSRETLQVHKDTLTLLVSLLAASIITVRAPQCYQPVCLSCFGQASSK